MREYIEPEGQDAVSAGNESSNRPTPMDWAGLLTRIIMMRATVDDAETLHDLAARYRRLSEAARDVAWEMKASRAPLPSVLPKESKPVIDRFEKAMKRVFKGGVSWASGQGSALVQRMLRMRSAASKMALEKFELGHARRLKVERFGLEIRRMARLLDGMPRLQTNEARRRRKGTRGRLPTVMPEILEFMNKHGLKPREMAKTMVEEVAHVRRNAPPDDEHVRCLDDAEWGSVDGDRSEAAQKWEHRIGQALHEERNRDRRPKRRRK